MYARMYIHKGCWRDNLLLCRQIHQVKPKSYVTTRNIKHVSCRDSQHDRFRYAEKVSVAIDAHFFLFFFPLIFCFLFSLFFPPLFYFYLFLFFSFLSL
jgi:hypothetical protein